MSSHINIVLVDMGKASLTNCEIDFLCGYSYSYSCSYTSWLKQDLTLAEV